MSKMTNVLGIIAATSSAIGGQVMPIIKAVNDLTDDTTRNDARAALDLYTIAGRITDSILVQVPDAPREAVKLIHSGLHKVLRGSIMAATGKDPGKAKKRKPAPDDAAATATTMIPPWIVDTLS